ncbi:bifunctional phosphatase PAP2/diacylglycerol kinase family protein [Mariniluteicoccus flavus]
MARRPSTYAIGITAASLGAAVLWTVLVAVGTFDGVDRATAYAGLAPDSALAQLASAFALTFHPWVLFLILGGIAVWANQRRMRNLAIALTLAIAFGWAGYLLLKILLRRERPATPLDVITHVGYAYPSGHLVAATIAATMIAATTTVTRQSRTAQWWARGVGLLAVALVAADRWIMNAHWLSDIVGGVLWGAAATSLALVVGRVRVLPQDPLQAIEQVVRRTPPPEPEPGAKLKRCAIVYNPTKVLDRATFQRHVEYELESRGWDRPIWLETTRHDPGHQMTEVAVRKQVDLVLGAGGDGTIRVVCDGLADTGIPFGIIPAGTGNLLARNLGIPLDELSALRVAFDGVATPTDLVKITVDDEDEGEACAVMAGIGIDAAIMEKTDSDLKKVVGSAAYFVAAAQNANHPPLPVTITVDGGEPFRRKAAVLLVGNVGILQGGIQIIPGARADDGELDLLVASPRTPVDWARLTTKVLTRRGAADDDRIDLIRAKRVEIVADRSDAYQLDGDTEGRCEKLVAEVMPGALRLMLPKR